MKSEIRNIKLVYKHGAFGDPNKFGCWIYGTRPDGRTVACKNEMTVNGGKRIWSYWKSSQNKKNEYAICQTEFSKKEWEEILNEPEELQSLKCNKILQSRS